LLQAELVVTTKFLIQLAPGDLEIMVNRPLWLSMEILTTQLAVAAAVVILETLVLQADLAAAAHTTAQVAQQSQIITLDLEAMHFLQFFITQQLPAQVVRVQVM
jgi:hypothetical protein